MGQDAYTEHYLSLQEKYKRLLALSSQINTVQESRSFLAQVVETAAFLLDVEVASILLVNPKTGDLRFEVGMDPTEGTIDFEAFVVPSEGSIAGLIVREGAPAIIDDVAARPDHFRQVDEAAAGFSTRSLLGVPICLWGDPVGVMEAINKQGEKPFSEQDLETLTALAAMVAVIIELGRLRQE